jgi:hypothetical protein
MGISAKRSVPGSEADHKYWAFISYSHRDQPWACWLHEALETYRVPKKLVGRPAGIGSDTVPEHVYPVFRDRDELAGSFDLSERIKLALQQSRYLVVICSPHAAASAHVRSEVDTFEALGREDRVICLIVDGEPNASDKPDDASQECLPAPVRNRKTPAGTLTPADPLAADVRQGKDGKANAKLKILATILGVEFDDLKQREKRRRFGRRLRLAGTLAGLSLLSGSIYLLALDAGSGAPGGQAFRRLLDRHQLSLMRPVHSEAAIRQTARSLRTELSARLQQNRTDSNWFRPSFKTSGEPSDVWIHSQVAWALLSSPDVSAETLRKVVPVLGYPFEPGVAVESSGVKYGWFARPGESSTLAAPGFWTSLGLALAARKAVFPTSEAREEALRQLSYAQEALTLYQPPGMPGWNLFPNQNEPSQHNAYATTLGLMALLEMRRAQLLWRGSVEQRDILLQSSFQWLVAQFDAGANPPGWQAGSESLSSTCDGLTLQIFGRLLEAEAEAGLKIPSSISKEIPRHLARCDGRSLTFPVSGGEFSALITDHKGQRYVARESINFLWHPWAIDCAARWLKRAETRNAPPEERVAVQRTLGYLVIDLGDEAARVATTGWTFVAAESLYGLSAVPPPDASKE